MQGVDTVSEGIEQTRSALREANQPGPPAPYSRTRLTVLDSAPFEGRRAQTSEDNQVCGIQILPLLATAEGHRHTARCLVQGTARCRASVTCRVTQVKYFKQLLLYCVAGLDRGFAANEAAGSEVERAVGSLQSATSPVVLSWTSGASDLLAG